jgi:FkbH-like protein
LIDPAPTPTDVELLRRDGRAAVARWRDISRSGGEPGRRVLVAASCTVNHIAPGLGTGLADVESRVDGTVPVVDFADYNQLFQLCFAPEAYGVGEHDDVVVVWRIEDVFERDFHAWANGEQGAYARLVDGATALGAAVADLRARTGVGVIVSDAPTPVGDGLDHHDPALLSELVELQHAVNAAFGGVLNGAPIDRLRLAALQHVYGTAATFDRRNWLMYRQPFSDWFGYAVGRAIADVVAARTRVPPKVVVLDADNTLWGGTLVDDGVGGLACSDAFPGAAFRSFQRALQRLRHRGVLLALASKNDDEAVREVFTALDGMVLTDADIAGRRVSWNPKPDAIAELADEFNLGLDAFVFVDDSPYEIGSVNTQLPTVRTLQVPDDIEALPDLLAESGLFRLMRVTDDDRERTERMRADHHRDRAATSMSHDDFLASLGLCVRRVAVGPAELGRVTQLVNKTNQFNLTTIRRSEAEVASLLDDPGAAVFAFSVDDRFGEYGLVGVVIAELDVGWHLDTVLMSCRVLGRGVETAMLASTVRSLRDRHGAGAIRATYRPTDRNGLVATLLADHGFDPVAGDAGGRHDDDDDARLHVLPADRSIEVPAHITVVEP